MLEIKYMVIDENSLLDTAKERILSLKIQQKKLTKLKKKQIFKKWETMTKGLTFVKWEYQKEKKQRRDQKQYLKP